MCSCLPLCVSTQTHTHICVAKDRQRKRDRVVSHQLQTTVYRKCHFGTYAFASGSFKHLLLFASCILRPLRLSFSVILCLKSSCYGTTSLTQTFTLANSLKIKLSFTLIRIIWTKVRLQVDISNALQLVNQIETFLTVEILEHAVHLV